jgi:N-acetylgalactosamine 4-sulfate 6-O-sulfotransferase
VARCLPPACRGFSFRRGINATLAEYMYEAQPYLRAIVMMRNPVDRYYSAFHYYG